jgi:hypothetical protein
VAQLIGAARLVEVLSVERLFLQMTVVVECEGLRGLRIGGGLIGAAVFG